MIANSRHFGSILGIWNFNGDETGNDYLSWFTIQDDFFPIHDQDGSGLANLDLDQDVIANPYTDIKAQ